MKRVSVVLFALLIAPSAALAQIPGAKKGLPEELPKGTPLQEGSGGTLATFAERPTATWLPYVSGTGSIVIESGIEFAREDGDTFDGNTFRIPTQVRYGVDESLEVLLATDLLVSKNGDNDETRKEIDGIGIGDVTLGSKWQFLGDDGTLPALASIAFWKLPTANDHEGLGTGEGDLYLLTAVGKRFSGEVGIFGNLGIAFLADPDQKNRFVLREIATVEARILWDDFTVFGEVGWLSDAGPIGGVDTSARVGAAYSLTALFRVDASLRFGLSDASDDFTFTLGLSVLLGSL